MSAQMFNSTLQTLRSNGIAVNNSHHTKSVYKLNHVWKIDNHSFHHRNKSKLKTPIFVADTNSECRWFITLEVEPDSSSLNEDVMAIYLYLDKSSRCERVFVKYSFFILDDELKKKNQFESETSLEFKPGDGWGFTNFIEPGDLSNKNWFPNDEVTIYCEAMFSESEDSMKNLNVVNSSYIPLQPNRPKRCLSEDFSNLLKKQELSDVTLSVNGKQNYQAHKIILAARSPVFAAMFKHNTKENENNLVEITDIEENVVEEMLRYIYTDKCENLKDLADGLLVASDKYDLEGLKIICQESLINGLTVHNAAETLNLAHLHCAAELKSKTVDFIVANSVEVTNSPEWNNQAPAFSSSLMMEIVKALSR